MSRRKATSDIMLIMVGNTPPLMSPTIPFESDVGIFELKAYIGHSLSRMANEVKAGGSDTELEEVIRTKLLHN